MRSEQLELFPASFKVCPACGQRKPRTEFHARRSARDGLQGRCKACNIAGAKRFHAENLEHCRARIAAWIRKVDESNKQRVLDYLLEHPCVDCGEQDPVVLEFDHRAHKTFTIASALHWHVRWEIVADEIVKCEVRCANCHRRRHAEEGGWFRVVALRRRREGAPD